MKYAFLAGLVICVAQSFAQDLTVVSTTFPASGKRYQSISGKISIHSETAISQYIHSNAYLSIDTIYDSNDEYVGGGVVNSIGGDEIKEVSVSSSFTQFGINVAPGSYYLIFQVDFAKAITETDETNNFLVVPFTVLPASVDLVFQNVTKSTSLVGRGGIVDVAYDIKNLSVDNISNVYTQFYLTQGGPDDARKWEPYENYNSLDWKQSTRLQHELTFEGDMPPGNYTLYAKIQNHGQEVDLVETNVANNTISFGTLTIDDQDLDVELTDFMAFSYDKALFDYQVQITNYSATDLAGYGLRFIFSANSVLDASDVFVLEEPYFTHPSLRLTAGETKEVSGNLFQYEPGKFIPPGTWYVFAEINYGKEFPESSYSNNITKSMTTITIAPWVLQFQEPPVISDITSSSFKINAELEVDMDQIYYYILPAGFPSPDKTLIVSSGTSFYAGVEEVVTDLFAATAYDVYFVGNYHSGPFTEPYKVSITTLNAPAPLIEASLNAITFKAVGTGGASSKRLYEVSAAELQDSVKLTTAGNFKISKDNISFTSSLVFSIQELNFNTRTVYIQFTSADTSGVFSGRIIHSTAGAADVEVALTINVFNPVTGNFNEAESLEEVGWQAQNPVGSQTWELASDSGAGGRTKTDNQVVRISGADGGIEANEDWLITPAMNLSTYIHSVELSFYSKSQGNGNTLELKYSVDYVDGDPSTATWIGLEGDFPEVNSNTWKKSSHIALPKVENVHVAFIYKSTDTEASTWMIDDWQVSEYLFSVDEFSMTFDNTVAGGTSSAKAFHLQSVGYGDVTIVASEGFEVSLDNVTFAEQVMVPASDMSVEKEIYVRFAPASSADLIEGVITISGAEFSVTRDVQGSSPIALAVEKGGEKIFTIYPNPTAGKVNIQWNGTFENRALKISIIHASGAVLNTLSTNSSALENDLSNVMERLPAGIYQVRTIDGSTQYVSRIVKQ